MVMFKNVSILLIVFNFWFLNDFEILNSTSQEWVGGRKESGSGVKYKIEMISRKSSEVIKIDELWINEDYFNVAAKNMKDGKMSTSFVKGDTIYIKVNVRYQTDRAKTKAVQKERPEGYSSALLLGYLRKGKRKYIEIEKPNKLKKIFYP